MTSLMNWLQKNAMTQRGSWGNKIERWVISHRSRQPGRPLSHIPAILICGDSPGRPRTCRLPAPASQTAEIAGLCHQGLLSLAKFVLFNCVILWSPSWPLSYISTSSSVHFIPQASSNTELKVFPGASLLFWVLAASHFILCWLSHLILCCSASVNAVAAFWHTLPYFSRYLAQPFSFSEVSSNLTDLYFSTVLLLNHVLIIVPAPPTQANL